MNVVVGAGGVSQRVRVLPIQNETNVRLLGEDLLHAVEGAAGLEPLDLGLVEGVVERDLELGAVGLGDDGLQGLQTHTHDVLTAIECSYGSTGQTWPALKVERPTMEILSPSVILS